MKHILYVIASAPEPAESIAFLSRNDPSSQELAADSAEDAARPLAEMRANPQHRQAHWLDKAGIYEVTATIARVN